MGIKDKPAEKARKAYVNGKYNLLSKVLGFVTVKIEGEGDPLLAVALEEFGVTREQVELRPTRLRDPEKPEVFYDVTYFILKEEGDDPNQH